MLVSRDVRSLKDLKKGWRKALVIMAIFRRRIEFPAALGDPYSRE